MFEVQMLIPVADNSGNVFSVAHHMVFENAIIEAFGGFTLLMSGAVGGWRDESGVTYSDSTRLYLIAVVSLVDGSKVGALAAFAKAHYEQLAISIRFLGLFEIL